MNCLANAKTESCFLEIGNMYALHLKKTKLLLLFKITHKTNLKRKCALFDRIMVRGQQNIKECASLM